MKILIEGEAYPLLLLEEILEDASFYTQDNSKGTITTVGYYYSSEKKSLVYMLPKVFMRENGNTVFDIDVLELADIDYSIAIFTHKNFGQHIN